LLCFNGWSLLAQLMELASSACSSHALFPFQGVGRRLQLLVYVRLNVRYAYACSCRRSDNLQELYLELSTARNLLPNRSNFFPQFTPHGVHLMPYKLPGQAMSAASEVEEDEAEHQQDGEVLADSVSASAS